MKRLFLSFIFLSFVNLGFGQEILESIYTSYDSALNAAKEEDKPIFIFMGQKPDRFIEEMSVNDTLVAFLGKKFINVFYPTGKEKRKLRKQYEIKSFSILILGHNETLLEKASFETIPEVTELLLPYAEDVYYHYSDEYKQKFANKKESEILEEIQVSYRNSSSYNTRQLTFAYLKNQESLLSPTNYQLVKSLMPLGDDELLDRFLQEMRPEMYTQEMAEKVAFEILQSNNFSIDETQKKLAKYNIPYEEQVSLYLEVSTNEGKFREKKENCLDFVLDATTSDYKKLSNCFSYILRNGNEKQIEQVKLKYMFTLNDVPVYRSLFYADLLGELFLSQGDLRKFQIMQKRNENIREKFLVKQGAKE